MLLSVYFFTARLNEFQKRSQCIPKSQLEPLMKRCLDENPVARGTFEDVETDLSAHQSNYGVKQARKLEEQTVRHLYELPIVIVIKPRNLMAFTYVYLTIWLQTGSN